MRAGFSSCWFRGKNTLRFEAGLPLYGHELTERLPLWKQG